MTAELLGFTPCHHGVSPDAVTYRSLPVPPVTWMKPRLAFVRLSHEAVPAPSLIEQPREPLGAVPNTAIRNRSPTCSSRFSPPPLPSVLNVRHAANRSLPVLAHIPKFVAVGFQVLPPSANLV